MDAYYLGPWLKKEHVCYDVTPGESELVYKFAHFVEDFFFFESMTTVSLLQRK